VSLHDFKLQLRLLLLQTAKRSGDSVITLLRGKLEIPGFRRKEAIREGMKRAFSD